MVASSAHASALGAKVRGEGIHAAEGSLIGNARATTQTVDLPKSIRRSVHLVSISGMSDRGHGSSNPSASAEPARGKRSGSWPESRAMPATENTELQETTDIALERSVSTIPEFSGVSYSSEQQGSTKEDTSHPAAASLAVSSEDGSLSSESIGSLIQRIQPDEFQNYLIQQLDQSTSPSTSAFKDLLNSLIECGVRIIPFEDLIQAQPLGSGYTFTVRKGQYETKPVALKFLNGTFSPIELAPGKTKSLVNQLHTEIRIMTMPGIQDQSCVANLIGVAFAVQKRPYSEATVATVQPVLVMPLARLTLTEHYNASGPGLPMGERLALAQDVVRGLASLHEAGFVVRDLKPDNILLFSESKQGLNQEEDGEERIVAKISDFGFATHDMMSRESQTISEGTRGWTTGWCAPEVLAIACFSLDTCTYIHILT